MIPKFYQIAIIFALLRCLRASIIERDPATAPLVYNQEQEVEFEVSETEFSYQINTTILNQIKLEYITFQKACESSPFIKPFRQTLFNAKMAWDEEPHPEIPTKNLIKLNLIYIQTLESDFDRFKRENNTLHRCKYLSFMIEQMEKLNDELLKLNKSTYITMSNIILTEDLFKDAFKYTSATNLTNTLDFTHWFTNKFNCQIGQKQHLFDNQNTTLRSLKFI